MRRIKPITASVTSIILVFLLIACYGCNDSSKEPAGLQSVTSLCFPNQQSNTSNQLNADDDWSITFGDDADWITVTPSSGSSSSSLIDLVFNVNANNDDYSRDTEVIVTIGTQKYVYQATQEGVLEKPCFN